MLLERPIVRRPFFKDWRVGCTDELRGSVPFKGFFGTIARFLQPEALTEVSGSHYLAVSPWLIRFSASGLAGVWAEEIPANLLRCFQAQRDVCHERSE